MGVLNLVSSLVCTGIICISPVHAPTPAEAHDLAARAQTYAYPLVIMDVTAKVRTSVANPEHNRAPINQFAHIRTFPDPSMTDVVSPNVDTLYSSANLDLKVEPMVLSVPAVDRYYLMPILDGWTNVIASPGTRTTGNGAGHFAIVGPGWSGSLPEGVQRIDSPTNMVWILGRTYTAGPEDYDNVHAIQDQYKLTPLSKFGTEYQPPRDVPVDPGVDPNTPPVDQVDKMTAEEFFQRANALMVDNPPFAADADTIAALAAINVGPGLTFQRSDFSDDVWASIEAGFQAAKKTTREAKFGKNINGWQFALDLGTYGTNYPLRAYIALKGLGANLALDAIYPFAFTDREGQVLTGANKYVIHFDGDKMPPVNAFWSLTMYNDQQFLVPNPINRYALGDRSKLKFNADGSLDIYVQNENPGADKESNWLPAPTGVFSVALRLYWPKPPVLDETWAPPSLTKVQ